MLEPLFAWLEGKGSIPYGIWVQILEFLGVNIQGDDGVSVSRLLCNRLPTPHALRRKPRPSWCWYLIHDYLVQRSSEEGVARQNCRSPRWLSWPGALENKACAPDVSTGLWGSELAGQSSRAHSWRFQSRGRSMSEVEMSYPRWDQVTWSWARSAFVRWDVGCVRLSFPQLGRLRGLGRIEAGGA